MCSFKLRNKRSNKAFTFILFLLVYSINAGAQSWTKVFTSSNMPDATTLNLNNSIFDAARGIVFSIKKHTSTSGNLYSFNISTKSYKVLSATNWPGELHHFVYDPARRRILSWIAGRDPIYAIPDSGGAWVRIAGNDGRDFESFGNSSYWNPLTSSPGFFGGYGFMSTKNWVYEVNGTVGTWVEKKSNVSNQEPFKRSTSQLVKGRNDSVMYLFSGQGNQDGNQMSSSCSLGSPWATDAGVYCWLRDIWEFNLSNFSFKNIIPVSSKAIPQFGTFGYDPKRSSFWIFSGFIPSASWPSSNTPNNKVFRYQLGKDTVFTEINTTGDVPAASNEIGKSFYDPSTERMILVRTDGIWTLNNEGCEVPTFNPFATNVYSTLDSLKLDAGTGYSKYRWSTGDTSSAIQVKYSGGFRVTVTNSAGCTGSDSVFVQFPDTVGLHISNVNALCNQSVDVNIRATGFRKLVSMQGTINWNAADLRFDSIVGFGPTALGLNTANFNVAQTSNGRLMFSWNDAIGTPQSLVDSTVLITLRFTALGTSIRSVPVTLSGIPTALEFYDGNFIKKSNVQTSGSVNISCELTISGKILTPVDRGVKNVTVTLTGGTSPQTTITDSSGNYSFKILPGTYTLTPTKTVEQFKTNGVSTIDLVFIQAHILQKPAFTSPYKLIAADVNNSGSVTTADILAIRRLILDSDTTFTNNRIWSFVDDGQTFVNPQSPFPFANTKTFSNLSTSISHTFRAIKMGDVNYDRNPLLDQAPSGDTLRLFGEWIDTEDGYVTLKVKSRGVSGLLGWQSTLRWDAKQLQLQSVTGMISNLGVGERWKDQGYLTLSWNDPRAEGLSFTEGVAWMELKFRKTSALQRTGIFISEEKLGTEAFNGNYQSMGVKMEPIEWKSNTLSGFLRVYPNPATQFMNIEWKMARAGSATVRLLDAQGRVVHVQRGEYGAGIQRVMIKRSGAWSVAGTWMVQVEVDGVVRNVSVVMGGEEPRP